MATDYDTIRT